MGNYSKNPQDVLADARAKNYSRVRFQQGKPILERELNLLGDLAGTARNYIGNGVPMGSGAFKITIADPTKFPLNDFGIEPGTCLVNGLEVTLAAGTTYQNQPYKKNVVPDPLPNAYTMYWIYLHVFTREVGEADDAGLGNGGDVGFETALREKAEWEVVVFDEAGMMKVQNRPDYLRLASIMFVQISPAFVWSLEDRRAMILAGMSLVEVLNGEVTFPARTNDTDPLQPQMLGIGTTQGQHHFYFVSVFTDVSGNVVEYAQYYSGAALHIRLTPWKYFKAFKASVRVLELLQYQR